ncbi:MAG: glycosyltransferase family 2 protein [Patescibacteria group bacterium]|nr:glycosyltransferase family 2 protein [Patescibacteria group bacterium]
MEDALRPVVDVIVVSYDHARFFDNLFLSLAKVNYPRDRWRLHVVINKDNDGTLEAANRLKEQYQPELPELQIHEPHANLGFSGGNNLAINWAMRNGAEYVYLLNPDTTVDPEFLTEVVKVAQSQEGIGSVQSLLLRGHNPGEINSRGNALHFLGFGYCQGDHDPISTAPDETVDIAYPSGAGVLFPIKVLETVGLLDETLFSYHEDLDLGWRILLSGHRNVLAPKSLVNHYYDFSRSITKWHWMERNRLAVVLKNYSLPTLVFLAPALIATDVAIWAFAVKGGWLKEKWKANAWYLKPSTWRYILAGREQIRRIRRVPDWLILRKMTWKIEYQDMKAGWAEKIANPFWKAFYVSYRLIVRW